MRSLGKTASVMVWTLGLALVLVGCGDDARTPLADDDDDDDDAIIDTTPPAAPTGLQVWASETNLVIEWANNSEADLAGYILEKSTDRGSNWFDLPYVFTDPAYEDVLAARGDYRVRALDIVGNQSGRSSEVTYLIPSGGGPKIPAIAR